MKNLSIILLFLVTVFGLNANLNAERLYDTQDDCDYECYGSCYKKGQKFYCSLS